MKFSDFDLREAAFSTRSRIFEAVDSSNSVVVRMRSTPVMLMEPLSTTSSGPTSRGLLSPVRALVFSALLPSTITPSSGIFSPGFTTMMLPTSTSSGSTVSVSPSSFSRLA